MMLGRLSRLGIAAKLVAWFLFIGLAPLVVVAWVAYTNGRARLVREVMDRLVVTADGKANQIEVYLRERRKSVGLLAARPTVMGALEGLSAAFKRGGLDSPEYATIAGKILPILVYYKSVEGFHDAFLLSPEGDVLFSLNQGEELGSNLKTGPYRDSGLAKAFALANRSGCAEISDFEYYQATNEPAAFIVAPTVESEAAVEARELQSVLPPVRAQTGKTLGAVGLQLSNREVYDLVLDHTGLGQTGETVLATRDGDRAVWIAPTRHDPDAAFRRRLPLSQGVPVALAAQGQNGQGQTCDYRGEEVLAVWRHLPTTHWGMSVKIDTKEAFASVVRLRDLSVAIGCLAALLVVGAALLVARTISRPIQELMRTTAAMAGGDLRRRVKVASRNEIGELAFSFNAMADEIANRTEWLFKLNEKLQTEVADRTRAEERIRELNADLQRRVAELTAANKELEDFSYTISHDLRAPVRHIHSFADLLRRHSGAALDEKGSHYLTTISTAGRRMGDLIDHLLAFARMGRSEMSWQDVDLGRLVREIQEETAAEAQGREIEWQVGDLPEVRADPGLLRLALVNLIANAVKFTRDRTPARIQIGCRPEAGQVVCFVRDNGVGFDPQYGHKLFGVFQRLHRSDEFEGTGIGLASVRRIVQRHGGRTWAEGAVDAGATIYFTLPREKET